MPRTCSTTGQTCASFRNCWGTARSEAQRYIPTSARSSFNEHLISAILESNCSPFIERCSMASTNARKPRKLRFFPPWFLNKSTMRKIERLLPYYYHKRFRFYFDLYGCIRCNRKTVMYACSGLCSGCEGTISSRLKRTDRAMKRRYDDGPGLPSAAFLRRITTARELLKDFRTSVQITESRIIRRKNFR